jgi:hypothetical protein
MALMMFKYKVKNVKGYIFEIMLWKNNLEDVAKHMLDNGLTIVEDLNGYNNDIFKKIRNKVVEDE